MLSSHYNLHRKAKQCRDRWFNNLKFDGNERSFSKFEFKMICKLFDKIGPQWSKISQKLGTKTENQIKNFMNATVRRNIRRFNKGKPESLKIDTNSLDLLHIAELREILLADKNCDKIWFAEKSISNETYKKIYAITGKIKKEDTTFEDPEDFSEVQNELFDCSYNQWLDAGMQIISTQWINGLMWPWNFTTF